MQCRWHFWCTEMHPSGKKEAYDPATLPFLRHCSGPQMHASRSFFHSFPRQATFANLKYQEGPTTSTVDSPPFPHRKRFGSRRDQQSKGLGNGMESKSPSDPPLCKKGQHNWVPHFVKSIVIFYHHHHHHHSWIPNILNMYFATNA